VCSLDVQVGGFDGFENTELSCKLNDNEMLTFSKLDTHSRWTRLRPSSSASPSKFGCNGLHGGFDIKEGASVEVLEHYLICSASSTTMPISSYPAQSGTYDVRHWQGANRLNLSDSLSTKKQETRLLKPTIKSVWYKAEFKPARLTFELLEIYVILPRSQRRI